MIPPDYTALEREARHRANMLRERHLSVFNGSDLDEREIRRMQEQHDVIAECLVKAADALALAASLQDELSTIKGAMQRARDSFGHATTQGGCQCVLCLKDWDGVENLTFDYEYRAFYAEHRAEAAESHLASLQDEIARQDSFYKAAEKALVEADEKNAGLQDEIERLKGYVRHAPDCLLGAPRMLSGSTGTGAYLIQDGVHRGCSCGLAPETGDNSL